MNKANEPAYPVIFPADGEPYEQGLSKRDKLAMEIYVGHVVKSDHAVLKRDFDELAKDSLRAADIFFDELNK